MKYKPSITVDDRGVLLHVLGPDGEGFAVPLDSSTVLEMSAALTRAAAALKTTEGRSTLLRGVGRLLRELAEPKETTNDDGGKPER